VTLGSYVDRPGSVHLFVEDTGEGIPPEMAQRLFEPFEQGGAPRGGSGGLGLGLAICRGIIEAHAGEIAAGSPADGRGTLVRVVLPTIAAPAVAAPAPRARSVPAPATRRILLVEDNPDNATAISEYLRLRGYEVRVAGSVATALQMAAEGFDVVVSDIGLPDGSGQDLVRKLRENGAVAAIALSGYGTRSDVMRTREAGFHRHLTKPVDPDELIDAIERVAAERGSRLAG
jgi:CheY-like chemotaxis protein